MECKSITKCHFGALFFLLAEIFPVSVILILFISMKVKLTAGGVTGLIFFAQMYISIDSRLDVVIKNDVPQYVKTFHHLSYQLFNFNFLELNSLSFCLWKNATTLDLLVIKYAVSAYALLLILGVVGLVRVGSRFKCFKFNFGQYSLVQVLSTFLVII